MPDNLEPLSLRNNLIDALKSALRETKKVDRMLQRELNMYLNEIVQGSQDIEETIMAVVEESERKNFLLAVIAGTSSRNPDNQALKSLIKGNLQEFLNFELDSSFADTDFFSSLPSLTETLTSLKDFKVVFSALVEVLPEVDINYPNIQKYLCNDKLSSSVKCLVTLQPFYRDFYERKSFNNQFHIVDFVRSLVTKIDQQSKKEVFVDWLNDLPESVKKIENSEQSSSNYYDHLPVTNILDSERLSKEDLQTIDASFLIFVKPPMITGDTSQKIADDTSQDFQVNSYLITRLSDHTRHQLFESIPEGENGNIDAFLDLDSQSMKEMSFLQKLELSLPIWLKQAEICVGNHCEQIQDYFGLDYPPNYELVVEFWLPNELLDTPVEIWDVYRKGRTLRKQDLRLKHHVVIRSYDRYSDTGARNELFQGWRELLSIKKDLSDEEVVETILEFLEDWDRLGMIEDSLDEDGRYLGLALCGKLCLSKSKKERQRLIDILFEYGIPMLMWSRNSDISGLQENFSGFFGSGELFSTKQILNCIKRERKSRKSELGKNLSLWYDDPKQFSDIRHFQKEGRMSA